MSNDFIFLFMIQVVFFMIRVDTSPILFRFFFHSIRVDPTRTGSPSLPGPTFVPASMGLYTACNESSVR